MFKAISLFSGSGGCSLGLRQAGFEVCLAADIDANACETYALNLGRESVWRTDLAAVSPTEILQRAHLTATAVNLIVGGPPCQGFSSAGARDWGDARNSLLRHYVEIVTTIKPTWFIMENVEGLLTANEGHFIVEAIARFLEAGYWVRAEKVYMERFGLPQRRKRVIVVGNLEGCDFSLPPDTHHERAQLPLFSQQPQLSIVDAIADLPSPADAEAWQYGKPALNEYQDRLRRKDNGPVLHHAVKPMNAVTQERIRLLREGATMKTLPEHLQHPSFTKRAFRRVMDGTPLEKRGGAPSGLKRLSSSNPSLTITSASPSEFVHPTEDRLLTLRECARIQSFPDWYAFHGSWSSIATQIGNAIPPLYMYQLAKQIAAVTSGRPVTRPKGRWLGISASKSAGMSPALVGMLKKLGDRTVAYA